MKKLIILLLVVFPSFNSFAGLFLDDFLSIDEYDRETGFYFKAVTIAEKSGLLKATQTKVLDVYIYFPGTNEGKYLFEEKNKDNIFAFIYESYFDETEKSISFNVEDFSKFIRSKYIKDNHNIPKRNLRDKLLIGTYNRDTETYSLWTSNKKGEQLKKLIDFKAFDEWHIDVKNSKLRIVKQRDLKIIIENIDW
jgi:hypothetical protein